MTTAELSDKLLIDQYLDGQANGFDSLYERYRKPLYSYLNRMLPGQTARVDDLFQGTWIKVLKNLQAYTDRQSFVSWLFRIAHNTAVDDLRQEQRHETEPMDDRPFSSTREVPVKAVKQAEMAEAIAAAVDRLPPDQREVFLLRQNQISFKEIAEMQECSLNTALGRMHYAIQSLRKELQEWRQD